MKQLTVLISGTGTTLDNLFHHCSFGLLKDVAQVSRVISNRRNVPGVEVAKRWQMWPIIVPFDKNFDDILIWRKRVSSWFFGDLIILAGFDALIEVPDRHKNKILNIHPSLLPKFGGKDMYGLAVHKAVLCAKEEKTGCTVHVVDSNYDSGLILAQEEVQILENDTPETLAERVKAAEKSLYPKIIRDYLNSSS